MESFLLLYILLFALLSETKLIYLSEIKSTFKVQKIELIQ